MREETIRYQDQDTELLGKLIYNPDNNLGKTIIFFPAFEGLSDFIFNYARSFASKGYITFVGDIYGNAKLAGTIEECLTYVKPFLDDQSYVRRRAELVFNTVKTLSVVNPQEMGAIGFCFGGKCLLEVIRAGHHLKAGVVMHGSLKKASNLTTAPIQTKLLILHGYDDPMAPASLFPEFVEEMKKAGCEDWTFTFFGAGQHSFTDPKTGTFNPEQEAKMGRKYDSFIADCAFQYASDFLAIALK